MIEKLRSFWFDRQGLYEKAGTAAGALQRSGWARSVGGSNPYLTLHSRAGITKAQAESAVATLEIHELPSARGCTHYVPASDFGIALKVGQGTSEAAALNTARKWLGFTDDDLLRLNEGILQALESGAKSPKELRDDLGEAVANFGEEGKKRGQTTSLSLGLGSLQAQGRIRRIAINGRLDTEHYAYALWSPNPLDSNPMTRDEALTELARRYFAWTGVATLKQFQWFSGLGVGASKAAVEPLGLEELEGGYLIRPEDRAAWEVHKPPTEPAIALISCIDSLILQRRDALSLIDEADLDRPIFGRRGLTDLDYNAIVDRGRIVGLWEFDPDAGRIEKQLFIPLSKAIADKVAETEAFIRDELGDARSFSLDSPKSRRPRLEALRA